MSKKKRQLSRESKDCFIFSAACIVIGILLIIYGNNFYKNVVDEDDVITGLQAKIVSVDKVSRDLSSSEIEAEKDKGYEGDELRYKYKVVYSTTVDGKDYTYTETKRYHNNGAHTPEIGDVDTINGAVVDGEFIAHPETSGANQFNVSGYFLLGLGAVAALVGFIIRK